MRMHVTKEKFFVMPHFTSQKKGIATKRAIVFKGTFYPFRIENFAEAPTF